MSSSSSNAAARRRRAGPPPMPTSARPTAAGGLVNANVRAPPNRPGQPNVPQQHRQQAPQQQAPQQQAPQPRSVMTPAQMLISHENRIKEFETVVADLMGKLSNEAAPVNDVTPAVSVDAVHQLEMSIKRIEEEVSGMAKAHQLLHSFATEMNVTLMRLVNEPKDVCRCECQHGGASGEDYAPINSAQEIGTTDLDTTAQFDYDAEMTYDEPTFSNDAKVDADEGAEEGDADEGADEGGANEEAEEDETEQ